MACSLTKNVFNLSNLILLLTVILVNTVPSVCVHELSPWNNNMMQYGICKGFKKMERNNCCHWIFHCWRTWLLQLQWKILILNILLKHLTKYTLCHRQNNFPKLKGHKGHSSVIVSIFIVQTSSEIYYGNVFQSVYIKKKNKLKIQLILILMFSPSPNWYFYVLCTTMSGPCVYLFISKLNLCM